MISNNQAEDWQYLVIYPYADYVPNGARVIGSVYVDDIRVTKQKSITITPSPSSTDLCQSGQLIMSYELTNDHCSPSGDMTLDLSIPTGLTLQSSGIFANSTTVTLGSFAPFESRTIQAIFNVDAGAITGQSVGIQLDATPSDMNNCYSASSNIQSINIIDSPLSSLDKNVILEGDGDYRFEFILCNSIEQVLDEVQIIDDLPDEFDLVTDNPADDPFQLLAGNNKQVQLFTSLGAASGGMDFCQSFYYTARPAVNFCTGTFNAIARIPNSGCEDVRAAIELEDPALPVLDAGFSFSVDCTNGTTTFTSNTTASGITHTWDFDDNGAMSTAANPTHTFSALGTYFVEHTVSNGCDPPMTEVLAVTYEPCPDNFNCTCVNNTNIGDPEGGNTNVSTTSLRSNYDNTNKCLKIGGNLVIDTDFTITGGEIIFEPGAGIIVNGNQRLSIFDADLKSCQNYLWNGITVASNAELILSDNTISDAVQAVQTAPLSSNIRFDFTSNTFDRNRIGVYVTGSPIIGAFTNNVFSCSSTLNNGEWGLHGILLENATLSIGSNDPSVNLSNTFQDMYHGIVASFSNVSVADANFNNLLYDENVVRAGRESATGIYADFFSFASIRQCSFDGNYRGIVLNNSTTGKISDNVLTNTNYGITARNSFFSGDIQIIDNHLEAAYAGIELFNVFGGFTYARQNTVELDFEQYSYVDELQGDGEMFYGIDVAFSGLAGDAIEVSENNITVISENGFGDPNMIGIGLRSSERIEVAGNEIELQEQPTFPGTRLGGIYLEDADALTVKENIITTTATGARNGIETIATTNTSFCCNKIDAPSSLMVFDGVCEGTVMNLNELGVAGKTARNALVCREETTIGDQVLLIGNFDIRHRGNRFLSMSYTDVGAVHLGDEQQVDESEFFVKSLEPPFGPRENNISPTGFFRENDDYEQVPDCDQSDECLANRESLIGSESAVAKIPNFTESRYSEMLNWETQQYWLKRLELHPTLLINNADLQFFQENNLNSALGRLMNITKGYQTAIKEISEALDDDIQRDILEELERLNDLQTSYSLNNNANTLEEIKQLLSTIGEQSVGIQNIFSLANSRLENSLTSIIFDNSLISVENDLARNEKIINNIYLQSLTRRELPLKDLQKELLFSVANQCPKSGGRYVYRARTLYNLLVQHKHFDDSELCTAASIENRTNKPKIELPTDRTIKIYPNPSSNQLTVEISDFNDTSDFSVELYQMTGKQVQSNSIQTRSTNIPISQLDNGVYILILYENGRRIKSKKIVILKK
ncbi:MAG: T9SS type A sorting domain-containing protein [Bacteroidota bacterium]